MIYKHIHDWHIWMYAFASSTLAIYDWVMARIQFNMQFYHGLQEAAATIQPIYLGIGRTQGLGFRLHWLSFPGMVNSHSTKPMPVSLHAWVPVHNHVVLLSTAITQHLYVFGHWFDQCHYPCVLVAHACTVCKHICHVSSVTVLCWAHIHIVNCTFSFMPSFC